MKKLKIISWVIIGVISLIIIAGVLRFNFTNDDIYVQRENGDVVKYDDVASEIKSFEDCANAGFPIMESYPERCSDGKNTFTRVLE